MRTLALLTMTVLFIAACSNDKEMDNLSLAQNCLDNVPDSNPQSATNCLQYTAGYSDQQAQLINCSIYLVAGGITTTRMTQAYNVSQDNSITNKTADYIAYLAFTTSAAGGGNTSAQNGYIAAQNANSVCGTAGDPGLAFIASMSVVGSLTNELAGGLNLNGGPGAVDSEVTAALANCNNPAPGSDCDPAVIGPVIAPIVTSAANSYCSSSSADATACSTISQDEAAYGSNPTALAGDLMCLMQNGTFDSTTLTCTP